MYGTVVYLTMALLCNLTMALLCIHEWHYCVFTNGTVVYLKVALLCI